MIQIMICGKRYYIKMKNFPKPHFSKYIDQKKFYQRFNINLYLNLEKNQIQEIEGRAFESLKSVVQLNLNENKLVKFEEILHTPTMNEQSGKESRGK